MPEEANDMARRAWVQAMFTQRVLPREHALALWKTAASVCGAPYDKQGFQDFLSEVSETLNILGFDVLESKDQATSADLVCLINLMADEPSAIASSYSKLELQYIKRLIELIFTASNATYCINSTAAIREATRVEPQMTKRACQDLLNNLVLHGWIRRTPGGRYALTQRTLLELRTYLAESFPEHARQCKECRELVTIGVECATEDCDCVAHNHCIAALQRGKDKGRCSYCKQEWAPIKIGNEERTIDKITQRAPSGRQSGGGRGARVADESEEEEEEEEEDGEDEEDELTTQTQPAKAKRAAPKRKRAGARTASGRSARVADDDEEEEDEEMEEDEE